MTSVARTVRQPRGAARNSASRRVPFPELVRRHELWRQGFADPTVDDERHARREADYHAALETFEDEHGRIIDAYWCTQVESAVALTEQSRRLRPNQLRFHRLTDWATKEDPHVRHVLQQCDEVAIRAREVLGGSSQRICLQLVMASACHLLSLLDTPEGADAAEHREAIAIEQREIDGAKRYYQGAANGEAQLVYFAGMSLGIACLVGIYLLVGHFVHVDGISEANIVGSLSAGALGALVSVMARINSGSFALEYDVSRGYTLFLGGLRPLLGSIFGVMVYFAITSGFLDLFAVPKDDVKRFFFVCVLAFLAGFSERWAQDTLTQRLEAGGFKSPEEQPPVAAPRPRPESDDGSRD